MDALNWRKASYSASNGGCVEVAGHSDRVLVRDTQDRSGPVLRFDPAAWRVFAVRVKRSLAPDLVRAGRCPQGHPVAGRLGVSVALLALREESFAGFPLTPDTLSEHTDVVVVDRDRHDSGEHIQDSGGGLGGELLA